MVHRKRDYYTHTPKILYINSANADRLELWYNLLGFSENELDRLTWEELERLNAEFKHATFIYSEKTLSKHTIMRNRLRSKFRMERFHINFQLAPPLNIKPETKILVQKMITEVFKDCTWL